MFTVQVPDPSSDLWDHVPPHTNSSPYSYDCHKITYQQPPQPPGVFDLCEKMRSTAVIEAAIDTAVGLGYTKFIVMGWSSGGAMASGFLDYAHKQAFVTRNGTRYTVPGLVLLSSGGQFCYAYKQLSELRGNSHWTECSSAKKPYGTKYGCCPQGLTEDYYWAHPKLYWSHPPTLLVQSQLDRNADTDAAHFYHETMLSYGADSTHFILSGAQHAVSPPLFGVVASWLKALALGNGTAEALKTDDELGRSPCTEWSASPLQFTRSNVDPRGDKSGATVKTRARRADRAHNGNGTPS